MYAKANEWPKANASMKKRIEVDFKGVRRHLFNAVVLDTNALQSMGLGLSATWFERVREICNRADIPLVVVDISVDEWAEHVSLTCQQKRDQVLQALKYIGVISGKMAEIPTVIVPSRESIKGFLSSILEAQGVRIIPTQARDVSSYVVEAISKDAPFEAGGKGFVDAVIVDSTIAYASTISLEARVLFVTDDGAVHRAVKRFEKRGLHVTFSRRDGAHDQAAAALSAAEKVFLEQRDSSLLTYVRQFDAEIFQRLNETPATITVSQLQTALNEAKLSSYSPTKLVSLRPVRVQAVTVYFGIPEDVAGANRYRAVASIECEIDLVIGSYPKVSTGNFSFASTITDSTGRTLSLDPVPWSRAEPTDELTTLTTRVDVPCSIARRAFDDGTCDEFQLENELSTEQWDSLHEHFEKMREGSKPVEATTNS